MPRKVEVLVLGGGIIGAAVADALAGEGADVLVVDRGRPGHGCSFGNAGWITPCFAMPLPRPGLAWTAARWMTDPESPFRIQLRPSPSLLRWLMGFARRMNRRSLRSGTKALVGLSHFSLDAYRDLEGQTKGRVGLETRGLLMVALTPEGADAAGRDALLMNDMGIRSDYLDADRLRALEPAIVGEVAGAVYYPEEAHLEPLAAVEALLCRARTAGARVAPHVEVIDFHRDNGRIRSVRTTEGWIEPDTVVLAAGVWSRALAARLNLRVPVLGGKGYSFNVPAGERPPRIPMMLLERKIAVTPYPDRVRVAGTLELVRDDESVSPRRLDAIGAGAAEVLGLDPTCATGVWRGLRPCTPDGLPIIGRAPDFENLYLATGHQMLGIQTAPATGRLMADLILGKAPAFDPAPFRPERFT